ncbi:MAG: hypothetical protein U0836_09300 [Pirellulales bacterium]
MARFVVPVVVLVALVGGYVAGQGQEKSTTTEALEPLKGAPGERVEDGIDYYDRLRKSEERKVTAWTDNPPPIAGRFQLVANGESILDTVDGTLYKAQGGRWSQAVSFGGSLEEKAKQLDAVTARLQSLSPDDPEREKLEKTRDAMERYIEFYGNR